MERRGELESGKGGVAEGMAGGRKGSRLTQDGLVPSLL